MRLLVCAGSVMAGATRGRFGPASPWRSPGPSCPPREWLDELLAHADELSISELHLRSDDPHRKAEALSELLDVPHRSSVLEVGGTIVRFVAGGPVGRPELHAELFV